MFRTIIFLVGILQFAYGTYRMADFASYMRRTADPEYSLFFVSMTYGLPMVSGMLMILAWTALRDEKPSSSREAITLSGGVVKGPNGDVLNPASTLPSREAITLSNGVVRGPNGEVLNADSQSFNTCGFCQTDLPEAATVCSGCGAEKGIGRLGKLGIVGEGAVTPMRIFTGAGWFFVLAAFLVGGAGVFMAFVIGLMMLAITLFNWRVLFWNGEYHWFRRIN